MTDKQWIEAEKLYVEAGMCFRDIEKRYELGKNAVNMRGKRNNWHMKREMFEKAALSFEVRVSNATNESNLKTNAKTNEIANTKPNIITIEKHKITFKELIDIALHSLAVNFQTRNHEPSELYVLSRSIKELAEASKAINPDIEGSSDEIPDKIKDLFEKIV